MAISEPFFTAPKSKDYYVWTAIYFYRRARSPRKVTWMEQYEGQIIRHSQNLTGKPLFNGIAQILKRVHELKKLVREFYFDVILSIHQCPECSGRIQMTGKSECTCVCGNIFDPTLAFQKSPCCGKNLVRKTLHYVCSGCMKTVASMFLFDEKLFDKTYFREMMRVSRARVQKRREEIKRLLAESRSGTLQLMEEPHLECIPGLIQDLNDFIQADTFGTRNFTFDVISDFKMNDYREHILDALGSESLLFSDISPLIKDIRRDKIHRFVTLIFMQNDHEVELAQYDHDILVERAANEAYG